MIDWSVFNPPDTNTAYGTQYVFHILKSKIQNKNYYNKYTNIIFYHVLTTVCIIKPKLVLNTQVINVLGKILSKLTYFCNNSKRRDINTIEMLFQNFFFNLSMIIHEKLGENMAQ